MPKAAVSVFDVAACILKEYAPLAEKHGVMTALKLQKLVYYSQAWSLVLDEEPLFRESVEAWKNGPVVRKLFELYRGRLIIREPEQSKGNPEKLSEEQRRTIGFVLRNYGPLKPEKLKSLAHREPPWKKARERDDNQPSDRGNEKIRHKDMVAYYASLI